MVILLATKCSSNSFVYIVLITTNIVAVDAVVVSRVESEGIVGVFVDDRGG